MDITLTATWGVLLRQVILIAMGALAGWAVHRGYLSQDSANSLTSPAVDFTLATVVAGGTMVWGWISRSKDRLADMLMKTEAGRRLAADMLARSTDGQQKLAAATAALPDVQKIVATPALAAAIPSDKVVPPGAS